MQTIYYSTANFIRHNGNLVDLDEFRRKLALARQEQPSVAPREQLPVAPQVPSRPLIQVLPAPGAPRPRRSAHRRRAWTLDACASLSVIVMTLTFALRVML